MSTRYYQIWPQITALICVLTAIGTYCLLQVTWGWGSDLGEFNAHKPYIITMLMDWLSGTNLYETRYWQFIYRNELEIQWLVHLVAPFIVSLLLASTLIIWLLYVPGGRDRALHVSGTRLLKGRSAVAHAARQTKRELRRDRMGRGISLFPGIEIPMRRELDNFFIYGKQGAGKGVVGKPLVNQAINRGDWVLIYDEKREYTEIFLSDSAVLISPSDARSDVWNPSLDVDSHESAGSFAECLISEAGKDPFWVNGARQILTGCLIYLIDRKKPWGWRQLDEVLGLSTSDLKRLLTTHLPIAAKLVEEDSKTTQSIMAVISTQLNWISSLAKIWPSSHKGTFSVSNWLDEDGSRKVVIIANNPTFQSIASPLCTSFMTLATERLLALSDSDFRRVWFSLDELGNLKKSPNMLRLLSLGRSKGARVIAGIQSISMLREIYGEENSESMLSLFGSVITLSTGSFGDTAKKAAEALGEKVIEIPVRSIDSQGNQSYTYQQQSEQVINASDITQLPKSNHKAAYGYLLVSGWGAVYRLDWPVIDLPKKYEPYVPLKCPPPGERKRVGSRGRRRRKTC